MHTKDTNAQKHHTYMISSFLIALFIKYSFNFLFN